MTGDVIDRDKIRSAAIQIAALNADARNAALERVARALLAGSALIAEANAKDVRRAELDALAPPLIKRLKMDAAKISAVTAGIRDLIALPDPIGAELLATELADGLLLRKVSCPIGVIGVVFESRPDALVQIACLCLKSGNAVILKGGSEAAETNRLLARLIQEATTQAAALNERESQPLLPNARDSQHLLPDGRDNQPLLPNGRDNQPLLPNGRDNQPLLPDGRDSQPLLPDGWLEQLETRAQINEILRMDDCIDLLIPRGSNAFVRHIMDNTRIPVLGHADGICHCYVDRSADIELAVRVVKDSKTQYAAVCNATETLLVHEAAAPAFLPALWNELNGQSSALNGGDVSTPKGMSVEKQSRVTFRGCDRTREILADLPVEPASEDEWRAEYLDYILAVRVVPDVAAAIAHINRYGSRHTDAIITKDAEAARLFMLNVDSANVYHNCSTRFSDGFRYGFGAEVGVSTGKIHARGPVGLDGLVTYKYLLSGHGDTVADFEEGRRRFTHRPI